jgi:hypothetical protein
MPSRSPKSPSKRAVASHRQVLAQTKAAVAKWAAEGRERREVIAKSMLELLADCAEDGNGDQTLEAVSAVFEEHVGVLTSALAHQLGVLADAARGLRQTCPGHVTTVLRTSKEAP